MLFLTMFWLFSNNFKYFPHSFLERIALGFVQCIQVSRILLIKRAVNGELQPWPPSARLTVILIIFEQFAVHSPTFFGENPKSFRMPGQISRRTHIKTATNEKLWNCASPFKSDSLLLRVPGFQAIRPGSNTRASRIGAMNDGTFLVLFLCKFLSSEVVRDVVRFWFLTIISPQREVHFLPRTKNPSEIPQKSQISRLWKFWEIPEKSLRNPSKIPLEFSSSTRYLTRLWYYCEFHDVRSSEAVYSPRFLAEVFWEGMQVG